MFGYYPLGVGRQDQSTPGFYGWQVRESIPISERPFPLPFRRGAQAPGLKLLLTLACRQVQLTGC